MKDQILDYLQQNKTRLLAETAELFRDRESILKRENKDFHDYIRKEFRDRLRGHILRDLSMNFRVNGQLIGIDYETSLIELEDVDLEKVLKC